MLLTLAAALLSPQSSMDTKDFAVKRHGAAKIEWDDHWLEADGDGAYLYQRFSYDGDWRGYNRATLPGVFSLRPAERGERQVDDCRKVGFLRRCRHAENVRVRLSRSELMNIAAAPLPAKFEFMGDTSEPYIVTLDQAEAALMLRRMTPPS